MPSCIQVVLALRQTQFRYSYSAHIENSRNIHAHAYRFLHFSWQIRPSSHPNFTCPRLDAGAAPLVYPRLWSADLATSIPGPWASRLRALQQYMFLISLMAVWRVSILTKYHNLVHFIQYPINVPSISHQYPILISHQYPMQISHLNPFTKF